MGLSPSDCGGTSVSSFVTADKWKIHPSIIQLMVVRGLESIPAVTESYVDSPKDFFESLWNLHVTCIFRITPVLSSAAQLVEHAELNLRSGSELCTVFLVVDLLSAHISCVHYTLPVQQCSQFGQAPGCLYFADWCLYSVARIQHSPVRLTPGSWCSQTQVSPITSQRVQIYVTAMSVNLAYLQ